MMRLEIIACTIPIGLIFAACGTDQHALPRSIEIEIRSSAVALINPATKLSFHREDTISGLLLFSVDPVVTNDFRVFRHSFEVRKGDQCKALVTFVSHAPPDVLDQVFLLPIAASPRPHDWTAWRNPDYFETNAASNLRFNYTPPDRATNGRLEAFQLRYRIQ